jgi:hypothetical protein
MLNKAKMSKITIKDDNLVIKIPLEMLKGIGFKNKDRFVVDIDNIKQTITIKI